MIGDLRAWGWVTLILSVLQLIAAGAVLMGNQLARWFAVAVVGLNAIDRMFFVPAYPFWALVIIAPQHARSGRGIRIGGRPTECGLTMTITGCGLRAA